MADENNNIWRNVLETGMSFKTALKVLPLEGNLVYEYNPFFNYRVTTTSYTYNGRLYSPYELFIELGGQETMYVTPRDTNPVDKEEIFTVTDDDSAEIFFAEFDDWEDLQERTYSPTKITIPTDKDDPILREPGDLVDFDTDELQFDINHPVEMLALNSYDGSVNLILNDGKNDPRLINSRFSATLRNRYLIVDRKGNNDTNIYDQGDLFDIDTSLYKRVVEIPLLTLLEIATGGSLAVGNYFFYFRYADADGNETDFVAESGLVSLFIGTSPKQAHAGFQDEDSYKLVRFILKNVDRAYQYVHVYYTRATGDIGADASTLAYRIEQQYLVNSEGSCDITITGYEDATSISTDEINPQYLIASSVETLADCQNMLFLANISKPDIAYNDLQDCALRFIPLITEKDYECVMDHEYEITSSSLGYFDPKYIYNSVGYWNHEIYRFGIVFILANSSLSPVFNVRGAEKLGTDNDGTWSEIPMWTETGDRNYISVDEESYLIVHSDKEYPSVKSGITFSTKSLENAKGVLSIEMPVTDGTQKVYGINFTVPDEVLNYLLSEYGIKGFFIVRQKRIPTILALAYMIGIDPQSNTPVLPINGSTTEGEEELGYLTESFLSQYGYEYSNKSIILRHKNKEYDGYARELRHEFDKHVYIFDTPGIVRTLGAICPEYDVDYAYLNNLFTGDEFYVVESDLLPTKDYLELDDRHFYVDGYVANNNPLSYTSNVIGVWDDAKLLGIGDDMFAGRAGEAEEAFRFEYIEKENKITEATNLLRASYGPYLGITNISLVGRMVDIKIPGFNNVSQADLFKIRYNDKLPFYAVSDRIDLNNRYNYLTLNGTDWTFTNGLYRGDCYICQFTHRVNRNFQDPAAPMNDEIADPKCWYENYDVEDGVIDYSKFDDINLGDVNAIQLGMWVTFTVRSTKNLNVRSLDYSYTDEISLSGHPRIYYPYMSMSTEGAYKTPEALCYNKGFERSTSERYNFELADVPAIKNDFTTRIAYSDIHVNDAFKNGYRVFQGQHYRDYPKLYGGITKIVELRGTLVCVCEHGVLLISVNERAVAAESSTGMAYINTSNVLPENPKVVSDVYGSQWRESVIKTPNAIYGVDTVARKIWRTNGSTFEVISDGFVNEFLNKHISLTERELEPIIGIRDVKTHYNKFKGDVMFTFYDNLYGFEEKIWNLCYNEDLSKWVTFYSWVPSASENIYNQYFSFDRNTSKWIAKLGVSHMDNSFSDGVVLSDNIVTSEACDSETGWIAELGLANRVLPSGEGVESIVEYQLERDNYLNYKDFEIKTIYKDGWEDVPEESRWMYIDKQYLRFTGEYDNIISLLYKRVTEEEDPDNAGKIEKDERGRRIWLDVDDPNRKNADKIVRLLNIRAIVHVAYNDEGSYKELGEAYTEGFVNTTFVDAGYYESVVAVIPEYNMLFLTTDFWKHGQAGIIDIADTINPAYWYGKQHPFEFEFVVNSDVDAHKIFDNLQIISNNVLPESFHYEIIGDCYSFANDKKNMYIRQEATKELYQYNGFDIVYDTSYGDLAQEQRPSGIDGIYDRSTLLPLYYSRQDAINEIEDYYHLKDDVRTKDFAYHTGGEIVRYDKLDEYHIWSHAKGVDIVASGRRIGNMQYKEDILDVLINPLDIVLKNEPEWPNGYVPVELGQSPIPDDVLAMSEELDVPDGFYPASDKGRHIVAWNWRDVDVKEVKLKDKWMKVRIRYKGDKLVVILGVRTLYSVSYS